MRFILLLCLVARVSFAAVDPYKELLIVDPDVVEDARANPGGPWHFSSLLREMLPADTTDAELGAFIVRWLRDSKSSTKVNGFQLEFPGFALGERTVCRWLGPGCSAQTVDPRKAPYRLIAISNRLDLDGHGVDHAEARFVFGALTKPTENPFSDPSAQQFPETVIFEYRLPGDLGRWAKQFHALGALSGEPYRQALEKLTRGFASRGVAPGRPNGNALGQIRTSHLAQGSGTLWSFRQFELTGDGKQVSLQATPVAQAPQASLDGARELVDWINTNRAQVLTGSFALPRKFWGGESILDEHKPRQWELTGVDNSVRAAFAGETCNGCHGEKRSLDTFFHISPTASGRDRVSDFLKDEELPRRAALFEQRLSNTR